MAFERIIFRATRGNVFLRQAVVEELVTDPLSGEKVCTTTPIYVYRQINNVFKISLMLT